MKHSESDKKNGLSFKAALRHSLKYIERTIGVKISVLKRTTKIYGANTNSFLVEAICSTGELKTYFLKFGKENSIKEELSGNSFLQGHLLTPKIILSSKNTSFGHEWILFEYIHGKLMAEEILSKELTGNIGTFYKLEKRKERSLRKLHSSRTIKMSYPGYLKSETNSLFHKRLTGKQYKDFYGLDSNISSLFDRRIILNGHKFSKTANQIFHSIREKYRLPHPNNVIAIRGHGDAHHGNILIDHRIWFIDNEYADYMTPFMELAKPYYNDFIGTLFFQQQDVLKQYFSIKSFQDTGTELKFNILIPQKLIHRLKITQIKLSERKKTINSNTKDFFSLNDYLVLCHTLTKNPNAYSLSARRLFLLFIELLAEFNPLKPESIYSYFEIHAKDSEK